MGATVQPSYALETLYLLVSGAFVMWMAAGFAMLHSGLAPAKDGTEILIRGILLSAVACILFMGLGYWIMYPSGGNGFIPEIDWGSILGGNPATGSPVPGGTDAPVHPKMAGLFFQMALAAVSLSIVSGAVAGRMRPWPFLLFALFMTGFIYPVQGYWKWGGGWLDQFGFSDLAGSGVVHLCGAAAGLAGVLLLGTREGKDEPRHAVHGANLPLATLGTYILWLGWFGINGGSQLMGPGLSDAQAVASVLVNTNLAAAGGTLLGVVTARLLCGKSDLGLALNGALAGLVAITAEPLTPSPLAATLIGAFGGALVVPAIRLLDRLRIDDAVGAISVHGVVGIWGLLAVPITNPESTLAVQAIGLGAILGWVFVTSLLAWFLIRFVFRIRLSGEGREGWASGDPGWEADPEPRVARAEGG